MLRLDTVYKGKRSNDLLKKKQFFTEEYKVLGVETGPMRVIDPQTGLEQSIQTLTSVVIEHKGNPVHVGSGFNQADRLKFFNNQDLIVGKTISVRYFEECQDKTGKQSLRFPTFVALHGDKRTT